MKNNLNRLLTTEQQRKYDWPDTWVLILNEDFTIIYANSLFYKEYGIEPSELISKTIFETILKNEDFESINQKVIYNKNKHRSSVVNYYLKSGKNEFYKTFNFYPMNSITEYETTWIVTAVSCISNLQNISKSFKSVDISDTFYLFILHEIRNTLHLTLMQAESLSCNTKNYSKAKVLELWKSVNHLFENTVKKINSVLDYAKLSNKKFKTNLQHIKVSSFIQELKKDDQLLSLMNYQEFYIENSLAEDDTVFADEVLLRQVLLNLILNAFKHSKSSEPIKLKLFTSTCKRNVYLKVIDHGIGISEENLKIIGRVFSQPTNYLSTVSNTSGLGVALTRELVQVQNGTILFESQLGKGTQVTVKLPAGQNL